MAAIALPSPTVTPVRVPAAAWAAVVVGFVVIYLMLQENGAMLAGASEMLHELFHDGRHALGVPCH